MSSSPTTYYCDKSNPQPNNWSCKSGTPTDSSPTYETQEQCQEQCVLTRSDCNNFLNNLGGKCVSYRTEQGVYVYGGNCIDGSNCLEVLTSSPLCRPYQDDYNLNVVRGKCTYNLY